MITEDQLEQQCLGWFREGGWETVFGPDIAHDGAAPERANYCEVVLVGRLTRSLARLNPGVPAAVIDEAVQRVLKLDHPVAEQRNRDFHRLLLGGIKVSWREGDGVKHEDLRLMDFSPLGLGANEFLVVNQFAIKGPNKTRRPDLVVFINGLPLALIELKNLADESADVWKAYQQLQTYKEEIPDIFNYNAALVVSDGVTARVGSLTADRERFQPWRTIKHEDDKPQLEFEAEKIVRGFFDRELFLDYLKHFILFEQDGDRIIKKIAGYHQFHAVREAVRVTIIAAQDTASSDSLEEPRAPYGKEVVPGSRKAGVVWHTQGSGKSISMVCYAGKLIQQPELKNPTIVVVTDRNDLDGQLYETFCAAQELLRQTPEQAESREELRAKLASRQAGGIIFTTIQKFAPPQTPESPSPLRPSPTGRGVGGEGAAGVEGGKKQYRGGLPVAGLVKRARELREKQTPAEELLWELLRNRQLAGVKFRRQHQFGEYICDFYAAEAALIVECDGESHESPEAKAHDAKRDAYLRATGNTVLRFKNKEVLTDTESVLNQISAHLPSTSGRGGWGEGDVGANGNVFPLNTRSNIVVISDEAHRSQYGLKARLNTQTGKYSYGFAKHLRDALPEASFIGFTGTPIESDDKDTRAVFGDYISIYDIQDAVDDGATVEIRYESRLAKLDVNKAEIEKLSAEVEEIVGEDDEVVREKTKGIWSTLEKLVGAKERIDAIAADLVAHFEKRNAVMPGKAMIVGMSRDICARLYSAIVALRPEWHDSEVERGVIKVVMTGSASDDQALQPHVTTKREKKRLEKRFKNPDDPLRLVIVRDMWLTGFDAPCCHTMYVDKPMKGHNLMQAIARVNRVFKDKPGGLVVDYIGIANDLKAAMKTYADSHGRGQPTRTAEEALPKLLADLDALRGLFHLPAPLPESPFYVYALLCSDGSIYIGQTQNLYARWAEHRNGTGADWTKRHPPVRIAHYELASTREQAVTMEKEWKTGFGRKRLKRLIESGAARQAGGFDYSGYQTNPTALLVPAANWVLDQEKLPDGKKRFLDLVTSITRAFALCGTLDEAEAVRTEIAFFSAVKAVIVKYTTVDRKLTEAQKHSALRQILDNAIVSEGVTDIFALAGLQKPNIGLLSPEFLEDVRNMPQKNLAVELLEKLLRDEIKAHTRTNVVLQKKFGDRLMEALRKYHNRAIETAQVIEELLKMAGDFKEALSRNEELGLSPAEVAFYDALAERPEVLQTMGHPTLKQLATELTEQLRQSTTVDWQVRDSVRAKMRILIKRLLKKYKYPPEGQEEAVVLVLQQAETLADEWSRD